MHERIAAVLHLEAISGIACLLHADLIGRLQSFE